MTFILTLSYILIVFLILIFSKLSIINENRIFGKYPRKTKYYWLKVLVMYVILSLRKFFKKVPADYFEKLDKPQQLSPTPKAADAVYFNGVNNKGECLIHGTARRHGLIDGFLYLKINASELGLLELTTLPDTSQIMDTSGTGYEAAGIKVVALKPMKTWKITFNGKLREAKNKDSLHEVSIEAIYTSDKPCFNYETQMEPWNMAKNIAYEKWSRKYFENFNNHHQLHYEQFGVVKANVTIDKQEYRLNVDCLRDHSVASHRDWGSFERYILHWISMENGDHFALGMICNPICYSRMEIGYMYNAREGKMHAISGTSFNFHQYGELGNPPKDYAFTFKVGKTNYAIQVNIMEDPYFYISKNWESKVFECVCRTKVNGVYGYGGVEWQYRNVEGRNVK